jgi:hypothetical protein
VDPSSGVIAIESVRSFVHGHAHVVVVVVVVSIVVVVVK